MPIYQYLLVRGIGKLVDGFVNPSDMQQVVDDTGVNPLSDTGMAAQPSIVDKAQRYLLDHYDSSNLRYLRALPNEEPPKEISRRYATYLWWQGATASLKRKQAGKQNVRGQLQVLVAVYIPITKECVSMIFCRPVPNGDDDEWVSTYDTTEGCFETPHLVSFIAAWAVLSVFTAGFPLFIYLKMSAMRDPIGAWKPGRFTSLVRLSYVFKEDHRAWQAVVMARQVWLVGWKVVADLLASPENQTLPFAAFNGALVPPPGSHGVRVAAHPHVTALQASWTGVGARLWVYCCLFICRHCTVLTRLCTTTSWSSRVCLSCSASYVRSRSRDPSSSVVCARRTRRCWLTPARSLLRLWSGQGLTSPSPRTTGRTWLC